jgi:predicted Rossmann-fold nucleotide-binding protein
MRIFLAGIMQGSHRGAKLHGQDYRGQLKDLLAEHLPQADVYDPLADHADSLEYGEDRGREVFWKHNHMCRDVDAVIAFVPEASMGTAIEMWEAYEAGRAVITISPLAHNWAVVFLSHARYDDFEAFVEALKSGEVEKVIKAVIS